MLFDYVHVFVCFFSIHLHSSLQPCPVCNSGSGGAPERIAFSIAPPRSRDLLRDFASSQNVFVLYSAPALIVSVVARLSLLYAMICTLQVIIIAALIRPTLGFIGSSPIICHRSSESARFGAARARNSKRPDLIGEKRQNRDIGGAVVAQPQARNLKPVRLSDFTQG